MTHYPATEFVTDDIGTAESEDRGWLTEYLRERTELDDRRQAQLSESLEEINDELDDLRDRIQAVETEINHHNFALFNPDGRVQKLAPTQIEKYIDQTRRGIAYKFFKSLTLGCATLVLGCVIAADISVDSKQRGDLSTITACTSAVAAWGVLMMGMSKPRGVSDA